jgi:hypothetical protein
MDLELIRPQIVGGMQRIGSKHDGGYVIPKNLPVVHTIVSFGLGDDWSFEKELLELGAIDKFIFYDHTVSTKRLINRVNSRMTRRNFSLSALTFRCIILIRYIADFKIRNYSHIFKKITESESSPQSTNLLEVATSLPAEEFILKIDIEGSEYLLIEQVCSLSYRVPLLIIEFHNTEANQVLFEKSLKKLLELYINCHVHANNYELLGNNGIPNALEFTFGRKDIYTGERFTGSLPIPDLDSPSCANRPDHEIVFTGK